MNCNITKSTSDRCEAQQKAIRHVGHSICRPYHFKFFKGCLLQILLGPFLNTLYQIIFLSMIPIAIKSVIYTSPRLLDDIFSINLLFFQQFWLYLVRLTHDWLFPSYLFIDNSSIDGNSLNKILLHLSISHKTMTMISEDMVIRIFQEVS